MVEEIKVEIIKSGPQGVPGNKGDKGDQGDQGIQGNQGIQGEKGDKGDTGEGVIAGGTANQVLAKIDGADYNTQWKDDVGASLTVKESDGTPSVSNVDTIEFDQDTGFVVTDETGGTVKVSLGSHWKDLEVDGQDTLIPTGEETLEFVAGDNVVITTDKNTTPKQLIVTASGGGGDPSKLIDSNTDDAVDATDPASVDILKETNIISDVPPTLNLKLDLGPKAYNPGTEKGSGYLDGDIVAVAGEIDDNTSVLFQCNDVGPTDIINEGNAFPTGAAVGDVTFEAAGKFGFGIQTQNAGKITSNSFAINGNTNSFRSQYWFKPASVGNLTISFQSIDIGVFNAETTIGTDASGFLNVSTNFKPFEQYTSAAAQINAGVWNHYLVTGYGGFDKTYLNGVLIPESVAPSNDLGTVANEYSYGGGTEAIIFDQIEVSSIGISAAQALIEYNRTSPIGSSDTLLLIAESGGIVTGTTYISGVEILNGLAYNTFSGRTGNPGTTGVGAGLQIDVVGGATTSSISQTLLGQVQIIPENNDILLKTKDVTIEGTNDGNPEVEIQIKSDETADPATIGIGGDENLHIASTPVGVFGAKNLYLDSEVHTSVKGNIENFSDIAGGYATLQFASGSAGAVANISFTYENIGIVTIETPQNFQIVRESQGPGEPPGEMINAYKGGADGSVLEISTIEDNPVSKLILFTANGGYEVIIAAPGTDFEIGDIVVTATLDGYMRFTITGIDGANQVTSLDILDQGGVVPEGEGLTTFTGLNGSPFTDPPLSATGIGNGLFLDVSEGAVGIEYSDITYDRAINKMIIENTFGDIDINSTNANFSGIISGDGTNLTGVLHEVEIHGNEKHDQDYLPADKIGIYESAASVGGGATEALTITGLTAGASIMSVTQKTAGANDLPIIGYSTQGTDTLTIDWGADPGAGAIVIVTVLEA